MCDSGCYIPNLFFSQGATKHYVVYRVSKYFVFDLRRTINLYGISLYHITTYMQFSIYT